MSKSDYFKELNYRLRGLPEKERHNILKVYEELFQKAVENGKHEDEVAQSLGYPRVPNWDAHKEAPPMKEDVLRHAPSATNAAHATSAPSAPSTSVPIPPLDTSKPNDDLVEPSTAPNMESYEPVVEPKIPPQAPPAWEPPAYTKQPQPTFPPMYSAPYPQPYPTKPDTGIKAIIISIMLGFFNLMFVVGPWFGVCAALIAFFAAGFALLVAPVIGILTSWTGTSGTDFQFISFALLACFGLGIILTTLSSWLLKLFFKLSWKYIQFNAKLIKGA